jgi:Trk-type K+ transport system membrane component
VDALFIVVLDLDNSAVNALSPGPRVLAALFQAASSRHTGTASFALAAVNPAVQFSLLVMMYVAVFPVAIAIRASNTYEEQALGQYHLENEPDDSQTPRVYLMNHLRNQLSFDLWYIFAGIFLICISESKRIADPEETAFTVFAIFFEVVSAYGNVGLSLGTMSTNASLSGDFKIFSKLVVCAMMYRGRHRGLPYAVDRAIVLPGEALDRKDDSGLETHRLRYSMKNSLPRFKTI